MKLNLIAFLLLTFIASSCSSVANLQKKPVCAVWRDQKYLGPYSVEVVNRVTSWSGECLGGHWKCREISISYDDLGSVLINGENILGKIEGNIFSASSKDVADTTLTADTAEKIVKGKDLTFRFNDKCSAQDAIIGSLAIGLITQAQKK